MNPIIIYFIAINIVTFFVYGTDKWLAKKNRRRISEKALWNFTFIGGSIGAYLAMKTFHHKTKHRKFTLGVPALIVFHIVLLIFMFFL